MDPRRSISVWHKGSTEGTDHDTGWVGQLVVPIWRREPTASIVRPPQAREGCQESLTNRLSGTAEALSVTPNKTRRHVIM